MWAQRGIQRGRERGSAALFVIGAVALSVAAGIGVYVVIKQQREASAAERATVVDDEPRPAPPRERTDPTDPAPSPAITETPPEPPAMPTDRAAADAVDPELPDGTPETTAPAFGTPGVDGALDKQAIVAAVAPTSPRLQKCFEQRYDKDRVKIGGTLRVTLEVNRRGGVNAATSVGIDEELGTCVVGVLKTVRFAKTADGNAAKIVYPIGFHSAGGDAEAASQPRPPGDDVCDEVACVLNNYEGACCAKFRRPAAPDSASAPDSPSRDELRTALGMLRSKVVACAYAQELTGTFKVRFKVAPSGAVSEVSIADAEPPFPGCVARAFRSYKFSASRNGVTASFPFNVQ